MQPDFYPLSDILEVASVHPFYSDAEYPPTREQIPAILESSRLKREDVQLRSFPVTRKDSLYRHISRLTVDKDSRNGYRQGTYISTTGGGSGGPPMVFATDCLENRRQRAVIGNLLRECGLIERGDWVLTLHVSGHLYRAIDLMTELFENAGAAVLCAGPEMPHRVVVEALIQFRANAVAGDVSQLLQLANYLTTLGSEQKNEISLNKIIYTSESMTASQREFLISVFGDIKICSVIGSAEAGPWGVSSTALMEAPKGNYTDFIVDKRTICLEVLPFSVGEESQKTSCSLTSCTEHVPLGQPGLLVQTSLQRLRNPLVRYLCGDVASLHPMSPELLERLPKQYTEHYQLVRIYGRDQRSSFTWYGEYFDFKAVQSFMRNDQWNIIQWQIILQPADRKGAGTILDVRVLRGLHVAERHASKEDLTKKMMEFFWVFDFNRDLFGLTFVSEPGGFLRSQTGRKVMQFVDLTA
ncbi:hypothetical protein PENFLA_c003G04695 [Penicillium flavigenum]|uniref:AMP-dependent synthetase/ligase domain-containing protein n=1 Tax=Penicillium flavigenum TaxID=254877 RepID=A0A1V6TWG4_9EURO|nr:hypothetical protein PENFLA_c003G04695 [Penicillium flavigenum]